MSMRCQSSGTVSGAHAFWKTIPASIPAKFSMFNCKEMADSSGRSSFSPATPGPQSSVDELVSGLLENPHFQDVLVKEQLGERIEALPYKQTNRQPGARHHGLCFRHLWKNFGRFLGPEPHHHRARILPCLDLGVSINDQEDVAMRDGQELTPHLQHLQMRVQELRSRHRSAGRWYCLTTHMIKP